MITLSKGGANVSAKIKDEKQMKLPNRLSVKLLEKRVSMNISQVEMAKKVGLSYPVYAGIERGTYTASLKLLTKISNYLDISLEETFKLYFEK